MDGRLALALGRIAAILVLAFLVLPIAIVVVMSFSDARYLRFPPTTLSFRWYENFFDDRAWLAAAWTSFVVAIVTTLIAVPVGTAAAYAANLTRTRYARVFQLALVSPVIVPIIIIAAGLYMVYAQVGLVATYLGLILAYVTLNLPYVFISVLAGLRSFDMNQEAVARSLGLNRFQAFMKVTLPQIRSSVVTGALFAFIGALDETVVALFISEGSSETLPKRMFVSLQNEIDPTIAAISSLLIFAAFLVVVAAQVARQRTEH